MGKHILLNDLNTGCTGVKPYCMNPPDSWNGTIAADATRTTLLAAGFTDDPDCAAFKKASACVTTNPSNATIDKVGLSYSAGSHAFILVSATKPVEVRVFNSNYNSGWVSAQSYGASIGQTTYEQRATITGPQAGNMQVDVRVLGSAIVRSVPSVSFGSVSRDENLYPATGGQGNCSISINSMQYDYSNNRLTAVVVSSGITGHVEYSIDQASWFDDPTKIKGLTPKEYTLYVRDSAANGCSTKRTFTVECVPPVQNGQSALIRSNGQMRSLSINYGTTSQQFRVILRAIDSNNSDVIFQQSPVSGGPQTFSLNLPFDSAKSYAVSVQVLGSLTCESVETPALGTPLDEIQPF